MKQRGFLTRTGTAVIAAALTLITAVSAHPVVATAAAQAPQPTLYERLGGVYSIATVVDAFIERLLVDATLNANPAISEARKRVPKAGLKFHVTTLVCEVTGGPCKYAGRAMKDAHQRLNITALEWDAMVADFRATLDAFAVPKKEQDELIAIVGSTRNDIVQPPPGRTR